MRFYLMDAGCSTHPSPTPTSPTSHTTQILAQTVKILHQPQHRPEVEDNFNFDNFDGEYVNWSYVIIDSDAVTNPEETAFARMLDRVGENNNVKLHFNLREALKRQLYGKFPYTTVEIFTTCFELWNTFQFLFDLRFCFRLEGCKYLRQVQLDKSLQDRRLLAVCWLQASSRPSIPRDQGSIENINSHIKTALFTIQQTTYIRAWCQIGL